MAASSRKERSCPVCWPMAPPNARPRRTPKRLPFACSLIVSRTASRPQVCFRWISAPRRGDASRTSERPSTKARPVLAALIRIGWSVKHEASSYKVLARMGKNNSVFACHDGDEVGPRMLARIATGTGHPPPLRLQRPQPRPPHSSADLHGLAHPGVRIRGSDQEIRHVRPGDRAGDGGDLRPRDVAAARRPIHEATGARDDPL